VTGYGLDDQGKAFLLSIISKTVMDVIQPLIQWVLTHYISENLVVPGIEPGPPYLLPGTLTTRPQGWSTFFYITYINSVRTSQETQYISVLQPEILTTRAQRRSRIVINLKEDSDVGKICAEYFKE
jgi:hypothetical protein